MGSLARLWDNNRGPAYQQPGEEWRLFNLSKRQQTIAALLVGGPAAASAVALVDVWMGRRARARIFPIGTEFGPSDGALVLGALVTPDGHPSAALEDRLRAGLALWQSGQVSCLILSGNDGARGRDEVGPMLTWLLARGVPRTALVCDRGAYRTLDSMVRVHHHLGLQRVIICTQADHLPRALYLADAVGLTAQGLIADRRAYAHRRRSRMYEWAARSVALADVTVRGEIDRQRRRADASYRDIDHH